MSYTVLARRYRSQTFDDVIGQDAVAQTLKNAIKADKVAHAYLFTGTRGVGKTTMARILAKALNCLNAESPTTEPCCKCDSCTAINIGEDIDVIEIDGASHTGVDNIRQLRQNAIYRPARARYKIYIIDEVHMLSTGAFNALLKILEEPPDHIKFIFATTEPNKVLTTIQSRCQRFDFGSISPALIAGQLKSILKKEKIKFADDLVLRLARLANGSMRDGLGLLDQLISTGSEPLSLELLEEFLGEPNREKICGLLEKIGDSDSAGVLEATDQLLSSGLTCNQVSDSLIDYMRDLMVIKSSSEKSELLVLTAQERKQMGLLCDKFDVPGLIYNITALEKLRWIIKNSDNPRALLEASMLRLALSEHFLSVGELLSRLDSSEAGGSGSIVKKKRATDSVSAGVSAGAKISVEQTPPAAEGKPVLSGKISIESIKDNWPGILEEVKSRGANISGLLYSAEPAELQNNTLTLMFGPASEFLMTMCRSPLRAQQIQLLLSKAIGTDIQVKFETSGESGKKSGFVKRPSGKEMQKEVMSDPAVKKLISGLNATITGIEEDKSNQ